MPSAEIVSYTAHAGRLGSLGSERLLVLRHHHRGEVVDELAQGSSEIYFADRFECSTLGDAEYVRAHLPIADYDAWLDLVRHEDPVYLHWSESETGEPEVGGLIHLSTGPEPPGEGPRDYSPGLGG